MDKDLYIELLERDLKDLRADLFFTKSAAKAAVKLLALSSALVEALAEELPTWYRWQVVGFAKSSLQDFRDNLGEDKFRDLTGDHYHTIVEMLED